MISSIVQYGTASAEDYGQAGEASKLVEDDLVISFKTVICFWVTEQPPKSSCHEVMIGARAPTRAGCRH